ncbi:hypothetical protein KP509_1Z173800 [Ceratopteris richardii]|nr:hypothetical protein KP509_1Z173800 [Ceratopteris richardii]
MSNASIVLGFTRNAIKVFLVLCLLHTWNKATPILQTEARKDIHQKTEPLVAHNDEENASIMSGNSKSMGHGITGHHLVTETTEAAASNALEKKITSGLCSGKDTSAERSLKHRFMDHVLASNQAVFLVARPP